MGDFLFGSEPEVSTQQHTVLTPEQQKLLNLVIGLTSDRVGQKPSLSQLELMSLGGLEQLVSNVTGAAGQSPTQGAAQNTVLGGLNALDKTFAEGPTDINEFFARTIQDPLLESFERDILPAIQTRHAPQFFGGERREAEGRARENLVDELVKQRANVGFQAEEAQKNRKLNAAQLAPGASGVAAALPFVGANAALPVLTGAASTGGATSQRLLDEMNRRIREALAAVGLPTFENVTTTTEGSSGLIPGVLSGLAGNAGFGQALGSAIFSSEEFKEDIEPAETILDALENLDIKSWRYKPEMNLGTERHVGPMAEDFNEIFGLGDGTVIPVVDAIGITMQSVKDLSSKVRMIEEALA